MDVDVSQDETFRFLDLPAEVRNKIYKILLVLPELKIDFEFNYEHYGDNDESDDEFNDERDQLDTEEDDKEADENAYVEPMPNHSKGLHIQMIRTCRQVASEATYNLYSSNKFTFDNMSKAIFFFDGLTYDKANMVKQILLEMNDVRHFQERMIPMILQDKFLTRKYDYVPAYQKAKQTSCPFPRLSRLDTFELHVMSDGLSDADYYSPGLETLERNDKLSHYRWGKLVDVLESFQAKASCRNEILYKELEPQGKIVVVDEEQREEDDDGYYHFLRRKLVTKNK